MLTDYFNDPQSIVRYRQSPAGQVMDTFVQWLAAQGYTRSCIRHYSLGAYRFGEWAQTQGIALAQWDSQAFADFDRYLDHHQQRHYPCGAPTPMYLGARRLVAFLTATGHVPAQALPPAPAPTLWGAFSAWMRDHRGISEGTIDRYRPIVLSVLEALGDTPGDYRADTLRAVFTAQAQQHSVARARQLADGLRLFLRFLSANGHCCPTLAEAIPRLANWRKAVLPKYLPAATIDQLLASLSPTTPGKARDRAILYLLARLALRAGDVTALTFETIDWPNAILTVTGKGQRTHRLPLPQDAGDALLDYLARRPRGISDHVFLTAIAPYHALNANTVSAIVTGALQRAGITTVRGAHVLRHSAATAMLRQGVTLPTISALLRHASIETTTIYAKVDTPALDRIAQRWPGRTPSC